MAESLIDRSEVAGSHYPPDFSEDEVAMIRDREAHLRASLNRDLEPQDFYKMLDGALREGTGSRGVEMYVGKIDQPWKNGTAHEEEDDPIVGGLYPPQFTPEDIADIRKTEVWLLASGHKLDEQAYWKMLDGALNGGTQIYVGDIKKPGPASVADVDPYASPERRKGKIFRRVAHKIGWFLGSRELKKVETTK